MPPVEDGSTATEHLLGDPHVEVPILDIHLAMRDQRAVGIDVERIVLGRVQFDDGAAAHAKQMVDRHGGGTKLDRDVHFNIV